MTGDSTKKRVLIADDEAGAREALCTLLSEAGYEVAQAEDGEQALRLVEEFRPDVVLSDLRMPKLDGMALLQRTRESGSDAIFVIMTAFGRVETAVEAMKAGAESYVVKPFDIGLVLVTLEKAFEKKKLRTDGALLRDRLREKHQFTNIIGDSPELQAVFDVVKRAAPTKATVLVLGESGTGKELVAQAIHESSLRRDKPFVRVNCAALSETLLESELFGHEKGSFTGAVGRREGRFEVANGGTLFLDEVGDISPGTQVRLLRVLQEHEFERVGGSQTVRVDVRMVAATNKDLVAEVRAGRFREDLFYRLNVVSVTLPPLRKRKADIPLLVTHFIEKYAAEHGKRITSLAPGTLGTLLAYDWPGNVRELGNVIERAVVLSQTDLLCADDLPLTLRAPRAHPKGDGLIPGATLAEIEREAILSTLDMVGGSTARAAEVLGISVRKIQYRVRDYALRPASPPPAAPAPPSGLRA